MSWHPRILLGKLTSFDIFHHFLPLDSIKLLSIYGLQHANYVIVLVLGSLFLKFQLLLDLSCHWVLVIVLKLDSGRVFLQELFSFHGFSYAFFTVNFTSFLSSSFQILTFSIIFINMKALWVGVSYAFTLSFFQSW